MFFSIVLCWSLLCADSRIEILFAPAMCMPYICCSLLSWGKARPNPCLLGDEHPANPNVPYEMARSHCQRAGPASRAQSRGWSQENDRACILEQVDSVANAGLILSNRNFVGGAVLLYKLAPGHPCDGDKSNRAYSILKSLGVWQVWFQHMRGCFRLWHLYMWVMFHTSQIYLGKLLPTCNDYATCS